MRFFPFECILEQFCYCTKLGAKRAKLTLMQKFVQQCLVRIFRNKCSRSTPLDPKLIFWCISFHLGAFGTVSLLHETRCKWANLVQLMQEFVPQSLVRISGNRRSRLHNLTLSSCFHVFLSVWVHLGPLCYCTNLMQNTPNWCN